MLERSRARSFLAILAERDLVFAADLPTEIQQARRRNTALYDSVQAQLRELNPAKEASQIESLQTRLRDLNAERAHIAEQIKQASPRLSALEYPVPLDLAATRQSLNPGTVLLSYSVGADRTLLFAVHPVGVEPPLSIYSLPVGENALRRKVEDFRRLIQQRDAGSRTAVRRQGRALYDLLLKPAEDRLDAGERLLIIPDGPLHILPFAALRRRENQYLVESKSLHSAVSATVYAELKKISEKKRNGSIEIAAFGDPRYPNARGGQEADRSNDAELRSVFAYGWNPSGCDSAVKR